MSKTATQPIDHQQRLSALDPSRSFIVQAPAGSGKTDLLVRRYLTLLARVAHPEEILAITFTRKATAEMRARILSALSGTDAAMDADMKQLAANALASDRRLDWNILANPRRLRIQTIDAFCYELVGRMPWSARFGVAPNMLDDQNTELIYRQAAQRTLDHLEADNDWSIHCANLIKLVDADFDKAQSVLALMLRKRDRWMRGLEVNTRAEYERMWRELIEQQLVAASRSIPTPIKTEIVALAQFAATNPYKKNPNVDLRGCLQMTCFPEPLTENIGYWRGIAALILTQKRRVRKTVDVRLGFPSHYKLEKAQMASLLESMADNDSAVQALNTIPMLPDDVFTDKQWQALQSLLALLPLAAAELRLLFKENNQADYVEVTQRAEMALINDQSDNKGNDQGNAESPSDLALAFDYQLKHLLMDEVQDTSRAQIALLTRLSSGWQQGDGRTLFFVGDPMQSIYRFREAEVANFLEIQENGIGEIKPQMLTLQTNFRSSACLVDWYNEVLSAIFPPEDDIINSAVSYSPSIARADDVGIENNNAVFIHSQVQTEATGGCESEAARMCAQIQLELEQEPQSRIGVLGRTRNHLLAITRALREHNIPFQAIELESLIQRPAIQDLMALTRGLIRLSDRIAWLAILRAPWCGMTLEDMSLLAMDNHDSTIMALCEDDNMMVRLSQDGRRRISRLREALAIALCQRGRVSLRQNVEAAWLSLSGPACINQSGNQLGGQSDNADCASYFDLLNKLENDYTFITADLLSDAVAGLWSQADSEAQVQLLTIHKAKGLEFDVVLLPQLHRRPRAAERELIRWTRLPHQLLIAVLPHSDSHNDKFYDYLGHLEQFRQHNELCRLLYVACTRARKKLHLYMDLFMELSDDKSGGKSDKRREQEGQPRVPPEHSLLYLLWPSLHAEMKERVQAGYNARQESALPLNEFRRLPLQGLPTVPAGLPSPKQTDTTSAQSNQIEFSWAGETVRITGIAIHKMLQHIDQENWQQWKAGDAEILLSRNRNLLMDNGLYGEQLEIGMASMRIAIENLKSDATADWIFSSSHTEVKREWPLTAAINNAFASVIIDRSFIDQHGVRWIIDFKSSHHKGNIDKFVADEQSRYQQQLEHYANIVNMLEAEMAEVREIKLGLYFPLLKGWCEWSPTLPAL